MLDHHFVCFGFDLFVADLNLKISAGFSLNIAIATQQSSTFKYIPIRDVL